MSPKMPILLLLSIILVSLGSCFGSYVEHPLYQENLHGYNNRYYPRNGRLVRPRHQHYGLMTWSDRAYAAALTSPAAVNVDDFGASHGEGGDATSAFEKAWNVACSKGEVLVVPNGKTYYLKPITFSGPCQPNTAFMVYGTILAWPDMLAYEKDRQHWILFTNIESFGLGGDGTIDGNGKTWWQHSCKVDKNLPCKDAPTAVTFENCNNLKVENVKFKDAQQMHVVFKDCFNVRVSNVLIRAPGNSPNTDGIHVAGTQNIFISKSDIGTGDDCISIVSGSKNVQATDITCGPGHGISIGSLGADNSEAVVSNVVVNGATLTGTTNGVRIKSWPGGSGYATNIKFLNIEMQNVDNPIIIDQNYCDEGKPCKQQPSEVALSDVTYQNIRGTSATQNAITFDCSRTVPCKGISVQNVVLESEGGGAATASCQNVRFINTGNFFPQCST